MAQRPPRRFNRARCLRGLALYLVDGLIVAFILAPIVIVIIVSFSSGEFVRFPPPGLSLKWYPQVFRLEGFVDAYFLSLKLALIVTCLSLILGATASLSMVRYAFPGKEFLTSLFLSPLIFPAIVTGIALLQFFSMLRVTSSFAMLVIGHTVITIPYVVRTVTASLVGMNRNVEAAARVLGADLLQTFFFITLPLIRPGILAGGIFAFIISFDNYTVSLFLRDASTATIPIRIFLYIEHTFDPSTAAASSVLVFMSLLTIVIAERLVGLKRLVSV